MDTLVDYYLAEIGNTDDGCAQVKVGGKTAIVRSSKVKGDSTSSTARCSARDIDQGNSTASAAA